MVAIVTDSAANIPRSHAGKLRIHVVPMHLRLGERVYRDGVDLTPGDFYRRLAEGRELASTSTPAPGEFLEAFQRTGDREIVCVTVASGMSAAHQEATLAASRFDGAVEVVDSGNASMAEGFVAMEAARMASEGATLGEVAARAQDVAARVRLWATIETFEYLRRSGRVRKLQAYAATALDINPVLRFAGGEATPVARPRTRRRALERLVHETVAEVGDRPVHLAVIHAAAEDDARRVLASICGAASVTESILTDVTPVIAVHAGPGLVGTAFFCD